MRDVHESALKSGLIPKPSGIPDQLMMELPLWSTWVEYKTEVNQSKVLDFGHKIMNHGFERTSHLEIDDDWETCYGEAQFNPQKFPDPKGE